MCASNLPLQPLLLQRFRGGGRGVFGFQGAELSAGRTNSTPLVHDIASPYRQLEKLSCGRVVCSSGKLFKAF